MTRKIKIYVVSGFTGSFEDQSSWTVKAFRHEQDAIDLKANARKRADEITSVVHAEWQMKKLGIVNEYDPKMQLGGFGDAVHYSYEEVELT